jgi:hypothetical protein
MNLKEKYENTAMARQRFQRGKFFMQHIIPRNITIDLVGEGTKKMF